MSLQRSAYFLLAVLSLGVAGYALFAYTWLPLGSLVHPQMRIVFNEHAALIQTHIFCSALALALGPTQFSARLRAQRPQLHRIAGRLYLGMGVLLGGAAGLYMALHAFGGLVSTVGFALLACLWLYSGARAYLAARARDFAAHRRWMVRNFSLTFAAVTLRIYLGLGAALSLPFEISYPVIAWLCWVPNLLLAERAFNHKPSMA